MLVKLPEHINISFIFGNLIAFAKLHIVLGSAEALLNELKPNQVLFLGQSGYLNCRHPFKSHTIRTFRRTVFIASRIIMTFIVFVLNICFGCGEYQIQHETMCVSLFGECHLNGETEKRFRSNC